MENKFNDKPLEIFTIDELFHFVPPSQLKRSIFEIFHAFVQNADMDIMPENFKKITSDFYFLYKYLESAEEVMEKRSGNGISDDEIGAT